MRERTEIAVACFQDFINQGFSFKVATEKSILIQMTTEVLFLKLGIEEPTDNQFGEVVACLAAIIQGERKEDA